MTTADTDAQHAKTIVHLIWRFERMFGVLDSSELRCELTADRDLVIRAQLQRGGFSALLGPLLYEHYCGKNIRAAWETLARDVALADARMHQRIGTPPTDFDAFAALVDAAMDTDGIEARIAARLLCGSDAAHARG